MAATSPKTRSGVMLGTPQLAFVRAWAEGIDVGLAWQRYVGDETGADVRVVRRELSRLLEELRRVARLHGRTDLAALLSRDPDAMVDRGVQRISLEEFRRGFDDDFYSESELLQLYQEAHGRVDARSASRRRQRLRQRLLDALVWLQERAAPSPRTGDLVTLWFDHRLSQRLNGVGILSLGDLLDWVGRLGSRWYRPIPRLGALGAEQVVAWLGAHRDSLGEVPGVIVFPRSKGSPANGLSDRRVGLVPIERLELPADERNGCDAPNRATLDRCKLTAANDLEAIQAWLAAQAQGSNTWRAYRREGERFLLWAVFVRGKAVSALTSEDCAAYRRFLLEPSSDWTAPRHTPRSSDTWRPMEGPLSPGSLKTAEAIVRTLCDWLVRQRYLEESPWDGVSRWVGASSGRVLTV